VYGRDIAEKERREAMKEETAKMKEDE
jgi:hypothetical protein